MLRHDVAIKVQGQWACVYNVLASNPHEARSTVEAWATGIEVVSVAQVPHSRDGREVFAQDMQCRRIEGLVPA